MSKHTLRHTKSSSTSEHGTMQSYVIGFLLSLVFTAIPYYLVVNKIVTGNGLLGTILGFAVLQMGVQVLFFLHLGRGPKPLYNVVFFAGTVGIILMVVGGSIFIIDHLHYYMTPTDVTTKLAQDEGIDQINGVKTGACKDILANHPVTIQDGKATPDHIDAHLCDTISFINLDDVTREISFGLHSQHSSYGGEDDLQISHGRSKTITLNQAGTYKFHDHDDPKVNGDFIVTAQ